MSKGEDCMQSLAVHVLCQDVMILIRSLKKQRCYELLRDMANMASTKTSGL